MATTTTNLFVTKLPRHITDDQLKSACSAFNPVSATVMLDAATGKSKGFGFVLFPTAEAGQLALEKLNGTTVAAGTHTFSLVMQPSKHDGRISCAESNALYVRNIPVAASRDDIQSFLTQAGTLSYSVMRPDNYGSPVWVVYAEYDCIECARQSLKLFHGNKSFFAGSDRPILAKFADTTEIKEYRRKHRGDHMEPVYNISPRSGSDASDSPVKEMVPGLLRTYRHNPYAGCVIGTPVVTSTRYSERKTCPQVGPWMPIAAY